MKSIPTWAMSSSPSPSATARMKEREAGPGISTGATAPWWPLTSARSRGRRAGARGGRRRPRRRRLHSVVTGARRARPKGRIRCVPASFVARSRAPAESRPGAPSEFRRREVDEHARAVIVGAGVAGLTAAYRLGQAERSGGDAAGKGCRAGWARAHQDASRRLLRGRLGAVRRARTTAGVAADARARRRRRAGGDAPSRISRPSIEMARSSASGHGNGTAAKRDLHAGAEARAHQIGDPVRARGTGAAPTSSRPGFAVTITCGSPSS